MLKHVLKNHALKRTATRRRRQEVPLLHWQHWLPGGQTWKARHSKNVFPNPAKRCFVASAPYSRAIHGMGPNGMRRMPS